MDLAARCFSRIMNVLLAVVLAAALILAGGRILGYRSFTVMSGSMEPDISTGSLIWVCPADTADLKNGDVITYTVGDDITVTHRIAAVFPDESDPDAQWFQTKGDANTTEDGELVHSKNVIGRLLFVIPKVGYVIRYLQGSPLYYASAAMGAAGMLVILMPHSFLKKGEKRKKGKYLRS